MPQTMFTKLNISLCKRVFAFLKTVVVRIYCIILGLRDGSLVIEMWINEAEKVPGGVDKRVHGVCLSPRTAPRPAR